MRRLEKKIRRGIFCSVNLSSTLCKVVKILKKRGKILLWRKYRFCSEEKIVSRFCRNSPCIRERAILNVKYKHNQNQDNIQRVKENLMVCSSILGKFYLNNTTRKKRNIREWTILPRYLEQHEFMLRVTRFIQVMFLMENCRFW